MPADRSNTNDPDRSRPSPGSGRRRQTRKRPALKDLFSPGDWIYVPPGISSTRWLPSGYGWVIAVRDSEIDVDFGSRTSTMKPGAAISSIEKVDGPESGHPGRPYGGPDGPDVYVTLDERHGVYAGKRGRLTGPPARVDGPMDGHFGSYFPVAFPGDPTLVLIREKCVYGHCRNSTYHTEKWYFKV